MFESGAIMMHLASRYEDNTLLPKSGVGYANCLQWLFFQVGGFGPIPGQLHHFLSLSGANAAPVTGGGGLAVNTEAASYGVERFTKEVNRQYAVMDAWLSTHDFFGGDAYTIADIAIVSWAWRASKHKVDLAKDFPNVKRWYDVVMARPAVQRGLRVPTAEDQKRPQSSNRACELHRLEMSSVYGAAESAARIIIF